MKYLVLLSIVLSSVPAFAIERDVDKLDLKKASQSLSNGIIEAKGFFYNKGNDHFGFGFRGVGYHTEQLNFPFSVYFSELPDKTDLVYFTLGVGWDQELSSRFDLQSSLNAGISFFDDDTSAFTVEPMIGIAYKFVPGFRMGIAGSYLVTAEGRPDAAALAVSVQFKTFSLSWPD